MINTNNFMINTIITKIEIAEKIIDDKNAKFAEKSKFCLFCESKEYNGHGIIHLESCPIILIRKSLALLNNILLENKYKSEKYKEI